MPGTEPYEEEWEPHPKNLEEPKSVGLREEEEKLYIHTLLIRYQCIYL